MQQRFKLLISGFLLFGGVLLLSYERGLLAYDDYIVILASGLIVAMGLVVFL